MSSRADRIRSWGLGVWSVLALIYLFRTRVRIEEARELAVLRGEGELA